MNEAKRKRLAVKGWRVGGAREFLALSEADAALIEVKLTLAQSLRAVRIKKGLGQVRVARLLHSSQSRVAKMEIGDASVDLLVRSHLVLGVSGRQLGRILSAR
jgi:hypothetical protein